MVDRIGAKFAQTAKPTKEKPFRLSVLITMVEPVAGMIDLNAFIDQMHGEQDQQLLPKSLPSTAIF